jgi:hypothetical protein
MKSNLLLRLILLLCLALSVSVFFLYRPDRWPLGLESLACLASAASFLILILFLWYFRARITNEQQIRNISIGLCIGLLWTVEISINNFIQPRLPYRDWIDNAFWAVITLAILVKALLEASRSGKILSGIRSGIWTGFSSGAVACLSALLVIVFGMAAIISDPLNIIEWSAVKDSSYTSQISVYFAFQSFAGAIMHLVILGIAWGLIFGSLGGLTGRLFRSRVSGR